MYNNKSNVGRLNSNGLQLLRTLVIGELDAVNTYKKHLQQSDNQELNNIIEEILKDEEKHIDILNNIIKKYDPKQSEYFDQANTDLPIISDYGNYYVSNDYNIATTLINEIKAELQAVNNYEYNTNLFSIPEIKMALTELMNDEKQHVAELSKVLNDINN